MTPTEWLLGNDTGISSMTIFSVMTGSNYSSPDVPHDMGDFGRCYRLLKLFPEWRQRLPEVAAKHKKWGPMVEAWDELTAMYEARLDENGRTTAADYAKNEAAYDAFFKRIQSLVDAGRIADGWIQVSPGHWKRGDNSQLKVGNVTLGF